MRNLIWAAAALALTPSLAQAEDYQAQCFDKGSLSYADCESGPSNMFVRLGAAYAVWDEELDVDGLAGDGEIENDFIGILDFGFFPTPEISITATITSPAQVTAEADNLGAIPNGTDLAKTRASLAALSVQYHFDATILGTRPYAGVGVVGAFFFDDSDAALTNVDFDNSIGAILHVGTNGAIDEDWGYFVDIKKFFVSTELTANGVTADVDLSPWAFHTGLSYRW